MISGPILAIRKFPSFFYVFYLLLLNLNITKTLVTHFALFLVYNLASCWCLTTTRISWGHKAICFLLQVARRVKKRKHYSLPRVTLVGNTSLAASL
jgi:hypothetical protein